MAMLLTCCLLILAMYLDIFGLSVVMPAVACDLDLSTSQQALLTAVPLIGRSTDMQQQPAIPIPLRDK